MKSLDRAQVERIVSQAKPGFRVLEEDVASKSVGDAAAAFVPPEDQTPDIETLRAMYLGNEEPGEAESRTTARRRRSDRAVAEDADDTQVVLLGSADDDSVLDPGPGAKTILVSRRTGRIRAQQG